MGRKEEIDKMKTLLREFKIRFIFADNPHNSYIEYGVNAIDKQNALQKALCKLNEEPFMLDEVNSIILRSCV